MVRKLRFQCMTIEQRGFRDDAGNIVLFARSNEAMGVGALFNKTARTSETENEYMKSILPKQKSYVCADLHC